MTTEPVTPAEIRSSPARGWRNASPRAEPSSSAGRPKRRILLVDDDVSVRESLAQVLRSAGYEVVLSADGPEAVERFDPHCIDLMLLDISMPFMNGWEVFERITAKSPDTPVIMITGQPDQIPVARVAGVGALMEKPLDAARLLETLRGLLAEPREANVLRLCGYRHDVRLVPPNRALLLRKLREAYSTPLRCRRFPMEPGAEGVDPAS